MANYTPNYRLHQWEPEDKFLRTDFNEDFSTIDAALGKTERSARASAYNVYNLMLQSDYEGKYTGYKKALLFDGFTDGAGIAKLDGGLVHLPSQRAVMLDTAGQGTVEVNHNRTNTTFIDNQHTRSIDWTAQGRGTLTGVSLDVITATGEPQCLLQIDLNGTRFTEETTVLPDSAAGHWYTLPLAKTVPLQKGDRVKITAFRSSEFGGIKIYTANSSQLGCRLEITSLGAPSGTLTAVTRETGGTAQEALAWVRHSGGSVALSLNGAPMTAGAARSTQDLEGRACTEQSFRLEGPVGPLVTPVLRMESGAAAWLYDYGVVLL